jgi:uncharacterized protein (TIGR03790 family)
MTAGMKAIVVLMFVPCLSAGALGPNEILVIANADSAASMQIAQYYCQKRQVPTENIFTISLGPSLRSAISRSHYEEKIAGPLRKKLSGGESSGNIKCLLTTYGVPYTVGGRGPLSGLEKELKQLEEELQPEKEKLERLKQQHASPALREYQRTSRKVTLLQLAIDRIKGKETNASVDSELSMVLFGHYDLYRWRPNMLRNAGLGTGFKTLMVSRIDGPGYEIAKGLVDKAMRAEKTGLIGSACIDSRGLVKKDVAGQFDQSLRDLAILVRLRTNMPVKHERTKELFAPGTCSQTALYCGWYSVSRYIDAFDFVDGAVGYHISSFSARGLRDPNSTHWCPAMLKGGITATLGAVAEPYLHSFPKPQPFFTELFDGSCLVEAFYRTKPFNSWQLVLIGDPLYRPFKKEHSKGEQTP